VKMLEEKGLSLTVAWIEDDALLDLVKLELEANPEKFVHISTGKSFAEWGFNLLFAHVTSEEWELQRHSKLEKISSSVAV
jgi:hypothetical protein